MAVFEESARRREDLGNFRASNAGNLRAEPKYGPVCVNVVKFVPLGICGVFKLKLFCFVHRILQMFFNFTLRFHFLFIRPVHIIPRRKFNLTKTGIG